MKHVCALVVMIILLSACESTQQVQISSHQHLHDEVFPSYRIYDIETEQEVFALDDAAREFVRRIVVNNDDPVDKMETLVRHIFDRSEFNLLYMGSANTTATETFHNRAANCLSMSIMTYALAKEAGFSVRFQDIDIPEYWTRRDGYSLLNGHINLQIIPRSEPNVIHLLTNGYEVDFDPQDRRRHFPKRFVSKRAVLAMFYNNKGADALLENAYTKAYAYFREAVKLAPEFDSVWVNLGFLYRLQDEHQWAEQSYRQALAIDPQNLTAWENLAALYNLTDRRDEARRITARIEHSRQDNPYYHFILGEQAYEEKDWQGALGHYRDALRLDKSKHEIYYGLAKTYYQLGDVRSSQRYFVKAKKKSRTHHDQERYQGKLDLLSRL